MIQKGKTLPKL